MELVFKPLTIEYQSKIDNFLYGTDNITCDYCLASILLFTEMKELTIAEDDIGIYIKGLYHDEYIFFSPLCKEENFVKCVNRLKQYSKENDIVLKFYATKQHVILLLKEENYSDEKIEEILKNKDFKTNNYCFENDRDSAEYIYTPSKLINLSGSQYKSKRNEIHHFCEEYKGQYEIRNYEDKDLDGVLSLVDEWEKSKEFFGNEEQAKLKFILEHRKELEIGAVVLFVKNKIIAASIYSKLASNVGDEVFERCDPDYREAYPFIARYVAENLGDCKYINFEEDLGLEGLRFSKSSYKPDFLIEKFLVCENLENEIKSIYQDIFKDSDEFTKEIFTEHSQCLNNAIIKKDNRIISCAFFRNKILKIGGKVNNLPVIYAVGTREEYRHQGLAKSIMTTLLKMINDQGYAFASLYPFPVKREFYEKMDFITFNYVKEKKLKDILVLNTQIVVNDNPNCEEYTNLFNKVVDAEICQYRNIEDTKKVIKEAKAFEGTFVEFYLNNMLYGYAILDNEEIEECILDNSIIKGKNTINTNDNISNIKLLNSIIPLFNKKAYIKARKAIPFNMIRPINKYLFIKAFSKYISVNKNINVNIFIKDDMIQNSIVNINIKGRKINIHSFADSSAVNVNISVKELTEWMFGVSKIKGLPNIKEKEIKTCMVDQY